LQYLTKGHILFTDGETEAHRNETILSNLTNQWQRWEPYPALVPPSPRGCWARGHS